MCGIFAYLSSSPEDIVKLKEYGMKCKHRGPDSTKDLCIHNEKSFIYFLFHRLSINGLNEKSNQPMKLSTNENHILICNGEIYNFKELANELNIQLETDSDCEILLHLYEKSKVNDYHSYYLNHFIHKLDGVFSFIIYDISLNQVVVGHDPFGIRPLYFFEENEKFGFSSEMKCLVDLSENVEFYPPGTFSMIDLNKNTHEKHTYYPFIYESIPESNEQKIIQTIQNKLKNAVKKRLLTERPFGCLLSGGLDSSIITAIVCQLVEPSSVRTFAIGLEGSPDLIAAQKVADHLGTNHTNVIVTEQEMLDAIDLTIYQIESKDITTIRASVPMFLLSEYIRDNTDIKVILSGEGSDEASGSYLYFHNAPSPKDFQDECIRLLKDVRFFDVLRSDKTTAGAGLEIRVPYFDKEFMEYYMGIDPEKKVVRDKMEKYLLRKAFENFLPEEIVWRRKDGFSDGVSSFEKPWYEIIHEYTMKNYEMNEKDYYLSVFQKYYPTYENIIPYYWMPKWIQEGNPSGRLIV
tara:strand:- start:801 stop:2360 length:1560 start_codon:yes stop_codon:yes gene_type:complete